ncbi:hypothetical protein QRX60_36490 [Amycolatopsis mongoliensis]|uniref:Uncharacterized protein n=1 Tax=Amycolatopsis mongoliensis TaxID=715475 RepID=A0A9Y2JKR1_9PSEU|nr:hypothetical protein [Amycolatopsis sp. 4-36]WIX99514.1 hypothetical protein QRX60_36490 [Amycolatopsis sp. 4-36]
MREGWAWRALAVTFAVVSAAQAYLAAEMGVAWAAALAAVFLATAIACGFAARDWRPR